MVTILKTCHIFSSYGGRATGETSICYFKSGWGNGYPDIKKTWKWVISNFEQFIFLKMFTYLTILFRIIYYAAGLYITVF